MKFEVYKGKDGFRFRIKSANGEIVATGESYNEQTDCFHTIRSIQRNAASASVEIAKAEEENDDLNSN